MSDTNQLTIDSYNAAVEEYLQASPDVISKSHQPWLDNILAQLSPTAKILEIGSGTGKTADYIEAKGYRVERTDASQGFIDFQQRHGKAVRFLNLLTDDDLGGDDYDLIYAEAVLLHFTDAEVRQALPKVLQALKPGGSFAFSLMEGTGEEITDRKIGQKRYFKYWQEDAIKQDLQTVGFISIEASLVDSQSHGVIKWILLNAMRSAA